MATRWAGVSAGRRKDERREMLVRAAYRLFGDDGEAALTVRAVCREASLHTRYFYENFADTEELLAAIYDQQAAALGEVLATALAVPGSEERTRAGIRGVLQHISDDPRRARVLFAETPVVASRRRAAESSLLHGLVAMSGSDDLPVVVAATMFTGAMTELAQQWADGRLGSDLDALVESAVALSVAWTRQGVNRV